MDRRDSTSAINRLIADIARKFVMVDDIKTAVNEALYQIGVFSNASRAYVFEFDDERINMDNTFEWCEEGVSAEIDNLVDLPISLFPWWISKLSQGEVLDIKDVSKLGEEAKAEREILEPQGIISVLVLPLFIRGELGGFVGFDNTRTTGQWRDEDRNILNMTSELFSSAFARMAYERELTDTNLKLKKTIKDLRDTQSTLVRQEQMAAIGQLAAGVAHEMNNPLSFIMSNSQILKKSIDRLVSGLSEGKNRKDLSLVQEDISDMIEDIELGADRVSGIVEGLLGFSINNREGIQETYDLKKGIENTLIVAGSRFKSGITVNKELPENGLPIDCVGSEINQVLLNIVLNAADVLEEQVDGFPLLRISAKEEEERVICKITDNGRGMTKEVSEKVFQPFFTTKPIGSGTGLGLSIAYDLVKKNGGDLEVESSLDKGTTFTLVLPKS